MQPLARTRRSGYVAFRLTSTRPRAPRSPIRSLAQRNAAAPVPDKSLFSHVVSSSGGSKRRTPLVSHSAVCRDGEAARSMGRRARALECLPLRVPPFRHQGGVGLPVRRTDVRAPDRHLSLVPAEPGAHAVRFPRPRCHRDPGRAGGVQAGDARGGQGHPALPCRRNGNGNLQDPGRLLDLPRAEPPSDCRGPLVHGVHVCGRGKLPGACLAPVRFPLHPAPWAPGPLGAALAIYVNFFTHHYTVDLRGALFLATAVLFGRTWVHFKVWHTHRRMPLLLGFVLVALFIWVAENIGTATGTWLYPSQLKGWSMVPVAKLGS